MLRTPTIHLNGTGKRQLLDPVYEASVAMRDAIEKLEQCAPNARDYYPQGDDAFADACKRFDDLVQDLVEVKQKVDLYAEAIADGGAA